MNTTIEKKHRPDSVCNQISQTQRLRYQKIRETLRTLGQLNNTLDSHISKIVKEEMTRFLKKNLILTEEKHMNDEKGIK